MLVVVQLWQISRASTTQEVYEQRRNIHPHSSSVQNVEESLVSAIVSGTSDPGMAALDAQGQGPDPPSHECHHHATSHNHAQLGSMRKIARLFGIDQFFSTAREGLLVTQHGGRMKQKSPYHGGLVSNCEDFWSTPPLDEIHSDGAGRLKGKSVDYYRLFELPEDVDAAA